MEKKARGEKLNPYEAKVVKNYEEKSQTNDALRDAIEDRRRQRKQIEEQDTYMAIKRFQMDAYERKSIFRPDENRVIDESGVFPVLSDKDAPDLYESWSEGLALQTLTNGRREGGGYFLPRMVFE